VTSLYAQILNVTEKSQDFEGLTTAEIFSWALENYDPRIGLACPFKPSLRAGRWWWENRDTKECGLHVSAEAKV
jgi:hypothetical protein